VAKGVIMGILPGFNDAAVKKWFSVGMEVPLRNSFCFLEVAV